MNFFKRKKENIEPDPLEDLSLSKLKVGYLVDYDLKTYEVSAHNYYDWNGDLSYEWKLKSGDETVYLSMVTYDEVFWSIFRTINFNRLGSEVKKYIIENEDPPDEIIFEGITYYLEESAGGHFYKDCKGPKQELLSWSYADDSSKNYLGIEQWGENEFVASIGILVEEYQFTNILPRTIK